jgi:hypothetical protein
MTAIAVVYDARARKFVIAADGRCASMSVPIEVKTDTQQKIFFAQGKQISLAYAMTGLAGIGDFEIFTEIRKQVDILAKRPFPNGHQFSDKLSFNVTKVIEKAINTGRVKDLPVTLGLPPEEKGRLFRLILLGQVKGLLFWRIDSFYHDDATNRFNFRKQSFELSQSQIISTGCETIHAMLHGALPVDHRISRYANRNLDQLGTAVNFVEACRDPVAVEIDPFCQIIGGHIHAAELTDNGFKWLIPPITPTA